MHILLLKSDARDAHGYRVEVWLERSPSLQVTPYLHAMRYRGSAEAQRRTIRAPADERLTVSAQRLLADLSCRKLS